MNGLREEGMGEGERVRKNKPILKKKKISLSKASTTPTVAEGQCCLLNLRNEKPY